MKEYKPPRLAPCFIARRLGYASLVANARNDLYFGTFAVILKIFAEASLPFANIAVIFN